MGYTGIAQWRVQVLQGLISTPVLYVNNICMYVNSLYGVHGVMYKSVLFCGLLHVLHNYEFDCCMCAYCVWWPTVRNVLSPCHSGADSVPAEAPPDALSQKVTGE